MWLRNHWVQQYLGGGWLERRLIGLVSRIELSGMSGHKDTETLRLIQRVRRDRKLLLTAGEAFFLHSAVLAQRGVPGELAEVGVFQGASARLMCEAKGHRTLHLFDTFEGMPEPEGREEKIFKERQYACSLEDVRAYLSAYSGVEYHQGLFPAPAKNLRELTFSLVHLDVDLYRSTLDCLEYFYPRLAPAGIIISHDYSIQQGVHDAFADFLADRPESVIELPTSQCMLVKRGAAPCRFASPAHARTEFG